MKKTAVTNDYVIIVPESVTECGLLHWLAQRFEGNKVTLQFDTKPEGFGNEPHPAVWIRVAKENS